VLLGQKIVLANHALGVQAAGSVILGVAAYFSYYVFFNRDMFAEARRMLNGNPIAEV